MKTLFRLLVFTLLSASAIAQNTESPISSTVTPGRDGRATYSINADGSLTTFRRISGTVNSLTLTAGISLAQARSGLSVTGPLTYNSSTGAFAIPVATNSVDGYLSAADRGVFNAKEPAITAGTTAQYLRGDKSLSTFLTDARAAISASGLIAYNSSTGALTTNAITGDVAVSANGTTSTLATVNANTGSVGSASSVPIINFDGKGRALSVSTATITPTAIGAAASATTLFYDKVATYGGASNSVTSYTTPSTGNAVMIKVANDENGVGTDYATNQIYMKDDGGIIYKIIVERKN